VARLAGVPAVVVARAREILENLERDEFGRDGLPRRARRHGLSGGGAPGQRPLFSFSSARPSPEPALDPAVAEVASEIEALDPDRVSPIEALQLLAKWRRKLREDAT
jgi:DNA mismatch repair protein MutS